MRITRKTNVLVKTERKFIVRQTSGEEIAIDCAHCDGQMIAAQTAAAFFQIGSREIYRFIESGKLHFLETETNEIFVCPSSAGQLLNSTDESIFGAITSTNDFLI